MSAAVYQWRTARKVHGCEGREYGTCLRTIQPGSRYLVSSLPPFTDPCNAEGWISMRLCEPCADYFRDAPADPLAAS